MIFHILKLTGFAVLAVLLSACNKKTDASGVSGGNEEVSEKLTSHDDILTQYFDSLRGYIVSMKTVVDLKTASAHSIQVEKMLEKVSSLSVIAKKLGGPNDLEKDELKKKFSRQWKILEAEDKGKSLWATPEIQMLINEAEKEYSLDAQDIVIEQYKFLRAGYDQNARIERINEIFASFSDPDNLPTEIPLSSNDVQLLLDEFLRLGIKDSIDRPTYLMALYLGKATDDVNISAQVANYARDELMIGPLRVKLFKVVGARGDESALPALIEFAQKTDDTAAGQGALNAAKQMATTSNFESLLTIITNSANASIKNSAVDVLNKVISASEDPSAYSKAIMGSYNNTADTDAKTALLRLMGSAGGDEASNLVSKTLDADDPKMKVAAIFALRNWSDDSQFDTLFEFASDEQDDRIRAEAFQGLVSFLKAHPELDEDDKAIYWEDVASIATGETEQRMVVDAMVSQTGGWADDVLDYFIENGDTDRIQFRAEKAKMALADRLKRKRAEDE